MRIAKTAVAATLVLGVAAPLVSLLPSTPRRGW